MTKSGAMEKPAEERKACYAGLPNGDHMGLLERLHDAGVISSEKIAMLENAYGKFPPIKPDTGAIVIVDGKISTAETRQEIWKLIATPEARAAGYNTIWYVGKNFIASWKDKTLKLKKLD